MTPCTFQANVQYNTKFLCPSQKHLGKSFCTSWHPSTVHPAQQIITFHKTLPLVQSANIFLSTDFLLVLHTFKLKVCILIHKQVCSKQHMRPLLEQVNTKVWQTDRHTEVIPMCQTPSANDTKSIFNIGIRIQVISGLKAFQIRNCTQVSEWWVATVSSFPSTDFGNSRTDFFHSFNSLKTFQVSPTPFI